MFCDFTDHATIGGDCDDVSAAVSPGDPEVCNGGVDDDCDGVADDLDPSRTGGGVTLYFDADGDGVGAGAPVQFCVSAPFYKVSGGDCDDAKASVYPGAAEVCNGGVDDDCDGNADDADSLVTGTTTWQDDADHDGWGSGLVRDRCVPLPNQVSSVFAGDCADNNAAIHPGATEVCNGSVDDDCDGFADEFDGALVGASYFADLDGDGFGTGAPAFCLPGVGRSTNDDDCNDAVGAGRVLLPRAVGDGAVGGAGGPGDQPPDRGGPGLLARGHPRGVGDHHRRARHQGQDARRARRLAGRARRRLRARHAHQPDRPPA
jgi:hypothetical protein